MRKTAVILALLLIAAKHPSPNISSWLLRYSSGVTLSAGPSFTFPRSPGSVNYLTESYNVPIAQSQALTMTVQIIGSPTFNYMLEPSNVCISPATVRPYLEAQVPKHCPDATYTCAPPSARQWSNPAAIELEEGTFTLVVPFTPPLWSDAEGVFGQNDLAGFAETLAHPRYLGMTFGGGCFFGHGVNVDGLASFAVKDFRVQ